MRTLHQTVSHEALVFIVNRCLGFFLLLFLCSCTKEVIVVEEVEKPDDWTRREIFNEQYFSFRNFSEYLLIQAPGTYISLDDQFVDTHCHKTLFGQDHYREPITERWIVNQNGYYLYILPSSYLPCDLSAAETFGVDLREVVDGLIEDPALWQPTKSFSRLLVSGNHIFLPYRRKGEVEMRIAIIKLKENSAPNQVEIENVVVSTVNESSTIHYRFRHWAVEDGFLFALIGPLGAIGTYKIDTLGEIRSVIPVAITSTFEYQGVLYGVDNSNLLRSDDNGDNWSPAFLFDNNNPAFTDFIEIEDRLFGLYRDFCVVCELSPEAFSCERLNTDDLSSQEILCLTKFAGQAVMITSAGIYTRDWESFMTIE